MGSSHQIITYVKSSTRPTLLGWRRWLNARTCVNRKLFGNVTTPGWWWETIHLVSKFFPFLFVFMTLQVMEICLRLNFFIKTVFLNAIIGIDVFYIDLDNWYITIWICVLFPPFNWGSKKCFIRKSLGT